MGHVGLVSRLKPYTYYTLDVLGTSDGCEAGVTPITLFTPWVGVQKWALRLLHLGPVCAEAGRTPITLWAGVHNQTLHLGVGVQNQILHLGNLGLACRNRPNTSHLFHLGQLRAKIHEACAKEFDVHDVLIRCLSMRPPKPVISRGFHVSSPRWNWLEDAAGAHRHCQSQGPTAETTSHKH